MDPAFQQPASRYIEVAHHWVSNETMPIYRWTFPAEATDEEVVECLDARVAWAKRAAYEGAWIIDCSHVKKVTPTQRRAFAEHIEWFKPYDAKWNAGSALIVPNRWIQGMVTAIFWLSKPGCPTKSFTERTEAEVWAESQLAAKLGPSY